MSGPGRIITIINSIPQPWRLLIVELVDERDKAKADLQNPAVLAALPEVQALIAGALQSIADKAKTELSAAWAADLIAQWVRNATPSDALAARDAMIAAAEARALDSVTTLHTVIADIRAATVGSKPMLSELAASIAEMREMDRAQAFTAGYEAGEKAEREAIVTHINGRIDHVNDCAKWGGSKQYLQSLKGGVVELTHCAAAIRKRGEE